MSASVQSASDEAAQEATIPEIVTKYNDRWVAIVVTLRDENLQPLKGRVVANDVDRYRLRSNLTSYNDVCIFFTGDCAYPLLL
ncbi:MAG: hypothetical protein ACYCPW_06615 [Nitrososphaerales archaeon]